MNPILLLTILATATFSIEIKFFYQNQMFIDSTDFDGKTVPMYTPIYVDSVVLNQNSYMLKWIESQIINVEKGEKKECVDLVVNWVTINDNNNEISFTCKDFSKGYVEIKGETFVVSFTEKFSSWILKLHLSAAPLDKDIMLSEKKVDELFKLPIKIGNR